jgi:Uma2 family endonuclease
MLTLPGQLTNALRLTPAQFAELCAANPEAVLELGPTGNLIEMTPAGGDTGRRNSRLMFQLESWARGSGEWCVFDSSTGFQLPDGSVRSPDASLVSLERWQLLTEAQRRGFPPLCPDLVVELASPSDALTGLRQKMVAYRANGARLGFLLLPEERIVEVWRRADPACRDAPSERLEGIGSLEAGPLFPELRLDLTEIWNA